MRWLQLIIFVGILMGSGSSIGGFLFAQTPQWTATDSLVAYLYTIRQAKQPDSVKGAQLRAILQQFHMDTTAYRQFYQQFMALPITEQQRHLQRAADLIRYWSTQRPTQPAVFSTPKSRASNQADNE